MKVDKKGGKVSSKGPGGQPENRPRPPTPGEAPRLGDNIVAGHAAWSFAGISGKDFSEHIRRSVPFYEEGHDLVCRISDFFVTCDSPSVCYELGTSTATLLAKLAERHRDKPKVRWVGIDLAHELVEEGLKRVGGLRNVELVVDDIVTYDYEQTDFIVSYLTVQFVPPPLRPGLIDKLYRSLTPGGGLVMFEKVQGPGARLQDMMTSLYHGFKLSRGYTSEDIINKAKSLEGILEPLSTEGNLEMLRRAGFVDIMTIMKYVCFEGFLAIK